MTNRPLRLVVCDDDVLVLVAIRLMLKPVDEIEIVAEVQDPTLLLGLVNAIRPDVVLCDLRMPGVDGLTLAQTLRLTHPSLRIVLMTAAPHLPAVDHARNAGADTLVAKSADFVEFREALTGQAVPSSGSELTPQERRVATRVARGETNAQIADELSLSVYTVKTYVQRAIRKTGVRNRVQLASVVNAARPPGSTVRG